jgi:hypothetical protein
MEKIFDTRGNLIPYEKTRLPFSRFKELFVDDFGENSTRMPIFEEYTRFLNDFRRLIITDFVQWVNGSFISEKLNPRDIDFVTLIDYQTFRLNESVIESQFTLWGVKRNYSNLDAYTIIMFPEGHNEYFMTHSDQLYWQDWFSRTKLNRSKRSFPKGFVEIHFDKNTII